MTNANQVHDNFWSHHLRNEFDNLVGVDVIHGK